MKIFRLLTFILLVACGVCGFAAQPHSVTVSVGSAQIARMYARYDHGQLNGSTPIRSMILVLNSSAARKDTLMKLLASQQNPKSPLYHKWLTPQTFGEQFGVSAEDAAAVASWLQASGMTGVTVSKSRLFVLFSGTADAVSNTFQTELHTFDVAGVEHFANVIPPSVPDRFSTLIGGIVGLDNFQPAPQLAPATTEFTSGSGPSLAPGDLAQIYGIETLYGRGIRGAGVTIAVLGRTPGTSLLSDYQAYRKTFGLASNDFTTIAAVGSGTGSTDPQDATEASLDLEVVGAVARDSHILYVWSDSIDVAAYQVVEMGLAQVMSESYARCEGPDSELYQSLALQASAEGITWVVASGDTGAAGCDSVGVSQAQNGLAVTVPGDATYATTVGGTSLATESRYWSAQAGSDGATTSGYIPESGWGSATQVMGGGGGVSIYQGKPGYQSDFLVSQASGRMMPDVSFAASPSTPYYAVVNGATVYLAGTSAATPVFAGILALVNQSFLNSGNVPNLGLGNVNPQLYRLEETSPSVFHDIESGDNKVPCESGTADCSTGMLGYSAASGYDLATGLGSVDATALVDDWGKATFSQTSATVASSSARAAGEQNVTLVANVQTANGPLAASPVQFYFTNPGISPQCNQANLLLLGTVPTDATGTASYALNFLPAGVNTIHVYATGTTSALPSAPVTTTVTVDPVASTTAMQVPAAPYLAGQDLTFHVQVAVPPGVSLSGPSQHNYNANAGQVSLYASNGALLAGPVTVSDTGGASLTTTLTAGNNNVYAAYSGSCYVGASQSSPLQLPTAAISTTTSLAASGPESTSSASLMLKATVVSSAGDVIPSGTVTFQAGGQTIGTGQLDATGAASLSYQPAAEGTLELTAVYGGDAVHSASTSPELTVNVPAAPAPDFTIQGTNTVTVAVGSTASVSLQITPLNGFDQAIYLSCSGLPSGASCTLPASITPSSRESLSMTVATTTSVLALGLPFGVFFPLLASGKRRRQWLLLAIVMGTVGLLSGCGGGVGGSGSSSGQGKSLTYPVTVTATAGSISHQFEVDVTICQ